MQRTPDAPFLTRLTPFLRDYLTSHRYKYHAQVVVESYIYCCVSVFVVLASGGGDSVHESDSGLLGVASNN